MGVPGGGSGSKCWFPSPGHLPWLWPWCAIHYNGPGLRPGPGRGPVWPVVFAVLCVASALLAWLLSCPGILSPALIPILVLVLPALAPSDSHVPKILDHGVGVLTGNFAPEPWTCPWPRVLDLALVPGLGPSLWTWP